MCVCVRLVVHICMRVCVCRLLYRSNMLSRFTLNVSQEPQKEMSNKKLYKFLTKLQAKLSLLFLLLFFVLLLAVVVSLV